MELSKRGGFVTLKQGNSSPPPLLSGDPNPLLTASSAELLSAMAAEGASDHDKDLAILATSIVDEDKPLASFTSRIGGAVKGSKPSIVIPHDLGVPGPKLQKFLDDPFTHGVIYALDIEGAKFGIPSDRLIGWYLTLAAYEGGYTPNSNIGSAGGQVGFRWSYLPEFTALGLGATYGINPSTRSVLNKYFDSLGWGDGGSPSASNYKPDLDRKGVWATIAIIRKHAQTLQKKYNYNPVTGWRQNEPTPFMDSFISSRPDIFLSFNQGQQCIVTANHIQGSVEKLTAWGHADRWDKDPQFFDALITSGAPIISGAIELSRRAILPSQTQEMGDIHVAMDAMRSVSPGYPLTETGRKMIRGLWHGWLKKAYGINATAPSGKVPTIRSGWGPRDVKYNPNASKFHKGLDLRALVPTIVYAPDDMVITKVKTDPGAGYGLHIVGRSLVDGTYHAIAHLSRAFVTEGTRIPRGAAYAMTGQSGANAPHLHVEYRDKNDKKIDPLKDPMERWKLYL